MIGHRKILFGVLAGAGAGIAANLLAPGDPRLAWVVESIAQPAGQIFLRLLFMLVIPMLFSAVVVGVSSLDLHQLGRIGARTFGFTILASAVSVAIGLALVNVLAPGKGLPPEVVEAARTSAAWKPAAPPDAGVGPIVAMIPDNPLRAAAQGDMIGVLAFSLFLGVGIVLTPTPGAARLREAIEGLYDVSMKLIEIVLRLAPVGVAALLFAMTVRLGFDILHQLAAYVAVVLLGLALHMVGFYSLAVAAIGRRSPVAFFRASRVAMLTAFSTASSNATLPVALEVAEKELRLPPQVARFVLTAGSTMNQNGTALFEGVTVLFLAQLFGVDLTLAQQAKVMLICVLGGIGTAGIPAGSLPVVAMILGMVHVPPEGLGLIVGVDRFLDMCRTTVNVTGDLAAAVCVAGGAEKPG